MSWSARLAGVERAARRLAAVGGALLGDLNGNPGGLDLQGERTVLLRFEPLELSFDSTGPLLVVGDAPPESESLPEHTFVGFDDPLLSAVLIAHGPTRVVVVGFERARLQPLRQALRAGAQRVDLVYAPGLTVRASPAGALALAGCRRAEATLAELPGCRAWGERLGWRLGRETPTCERSAAAAAALVASAGPGAPLPPGPLRIAQHISSLGPGGAERQLSYLSRELVAAGHEVTVLSGLPLEGLEAHYLPDVERAGARAEGLDELPVWRELPSTLAALPPAVRAALDAHAVRRKVVPLVERCLALRPDVLHAWMDEPNLVGGLAGLAAGVPRIVLAARTGRPTIYPDRFFPWFRDTYRALAGSERVLLVANSRVAADDYADWMGVPREWFQIIPNGLPVERWTPLDPSERAAGRRALGVPDDAFLVAGMFRLSDEKRPADFVEAIAAARERIPGLRAIHIGDGIRREAIEALARERGLEGTLQFLGRREDPRALIGMADATLLPSAVEGSPNVSLESQSLEVPIVLTAVFGSPETIRDRETGFLVEVGDVAAMVQHLAWLAEDPERRRAMGREGSEHVRTHFALEALARRTLTLYRTGRLED